MDKYVYYPSHDVVGSPLGSTIAATERECARACCDVPLCDAYAFCTLFAPALCSFITNVTHVYSAHAFNVGVATRAL